MAPLLIDERYDGVQGVGAAVDDRLRHPVGGLRVAGSHGVDNGPIAGDVSDLITEDLDQGWTHLFVDSG